MNMRTKLGLILAVVMIFTATDSFAKKTKKPDPNFFVYLCFGQSNMEAGARPEEQDKVIDSRFQMLAAVDNAKLSRIKGNWYVASPPINRPENAMGPVDFFGRTMVANLPEKYRVGVINVSVAGAKIELWDKDGYQTYLSGAEKWMQNMCKQYDGNPYQRLVEMAKLAQKDGVIKGILIHQGESNSTDPEWPNKVKAIYNNLMKDLNLNPKKVPLLAGELKSKEEHGVCYAFNTDILVNLPKVLPNSYIISSQGVKGSSDQFHFNTDGMRELGRRYAVQMLKIQGFKYAAASTQQSQESVNTPYRVELNVNKTGITVSPTFHGIFFEDINQSNDGGISAQLIQNNSFQAYNVPGAGEFGPNGNKTPEFSKSPTEIYGWTVVSNEGASGTATTVEDKPLVTYEKLYGFDENDQYDDALKYKQYCIRFDIQNPGKGFGLAANGFGINKYGPENQGNYYSNNTQTPSIAVNAGVSYDLGLYLQGKDYTGSVRIYLEDAAGKINSNVLTIKGLRNFWKKGKGKLKAQRSVDSRLVVVANAAGTFYLDFVTLIPEAKHLWRNGKYGAFRKDLMEALEQLNPKFMRFPGGCATEGSNYWGQYFWKNTVGSVEERIGVRNHWGTWTSQYIGFYEYFVMSEALGAKPLPVINNGVTCQFAGRSYIAPLGTDAEKKRYYDIYVKDALDLIEFCNGDASTEWGAKRIAYGHPKPFNLEYLAVGNENSGPAFWERFDIIQQAVKQKYPNINLITTSGAGASGNEFNANYSIIDEKYPVSIVDEHYYSNDNWFYSNTHRYDVGKARGNQGNTYDRSNPTRVFVGEYANNNANNAFSSALAEAAFTTGLERNSDMVVMAAYAPLFCKKGFNKWNSNLIWFDNRGLWRSTNYYYMSLYANNTGDKTIDSSPFTKTADKAEDSKVYTSPTLDTKSGTVYLKVVNADHVAKATTVVINGSNSYYKATLEYLSSEATTVKNQGTQNFYSTASGVENFSYTEAVTPKTMDLGIVSGSFNVSIPVNSVNVVKLVPVKSK